MNEPHNIPDMSIWAKSVQAAVTAIRQAGATTQMILLPGKDFTSAQTFVSNGSGGNLSRVHNLDGSNTSLIFDVHKYLDIDNSGTHLECTSNHIVDTFMPLTVFLKANNRVAFLTETGGGNTTSVRPSPYLPHLDHFTDACQCLTDLCNTLTFINANNRYIPGLRRMGSWRFFTHNLKFDDDLDGRRWEFHRPANRKPMSCWYSQRWGNC